MKSNGKIKFELQELHYDNIFILLYRTVFTKNPKQMIGIFYNPRKFYFHVLIWNNNGNIYKKKIKLRKIKNFIPYVKHML